MLVRSVKFPDEQAKIVYQETFGLAIITINRPHAKNAMTASMWDQLGYFIELAGVNQANKVLLIRGVGKNFTAGSDIKEFHARTLEEAEAAFINMEQAISQVEKLAIPVVAAIHGPAMGAGLELALACDLRIGSQFAKLGIPVGKLGITLNQNFAKRLVDLVGPAKTKDFVYTGRIYNANEAYQAGLLNYLTESEDITREALKLCFTIASMSPHSLRAVKQSVAACINETPSTWGELTPFVSIADFKEGISAFVEKRTPQF